MKIDDQASDKQLAELLNKVEQAGIGSEELARYLQELQVHQIELEQQNRELREMRAVLEESRKRYADLYDFAPVGYLSLDAAGILRAINLTGAELLGEPRKAISGRPLADFVAPEDHAILLAHLAETLHAAERRICELRIMPSQASQTSAARVMRMESLIETGSKPQGIRSILTDITDSKQAELERRARAAAAAAAKSRDRLITALERLSAAATTTFDPDRTLNGLLLVVKDIFQVDRAWLLSPCDPAETLVIIRADTGTSSLVEEPVDGGRCITLDTPLRSLLQLASDAKGPVADPNPTAATALDGDIKCRSRLVIPICPEGEKTSLLGLHESRFERAWSEEDLELAQAIGSRLGQIIEMLGMQRALAESEERFRGTFEEAAVGICHMDRGGWFLRANRKLCAILGYSEDELLAHTCCDLTHPEDRAALRQYIEDVSGGTEANNGIEIRKIDARGRMTWCRLTMAALQDARCRFKYFISVIEDISARKILEDREHKHRDALARANRISAMGEMSTAIAHEITQPLMAISNYAGGALQRLDSTPTAIEPVRGALLKVSGLADRAGRIIKDLRDFAEQRPSRPRMTDLRDVARDALRIVETEIKANHAKIDTVFPCKLPLALCDPIELEQVVVNLLLNSLDAMRAIPVADRQLSIEVECSDPHEIRVTIADRGVGLTDNVSNRLFEHFFTTKDGGTGLGLPVCRTIIESYGGRIWAAPRLGGGAVFAFTLPADREDDQI
jgi:PAS domain S-box-containing protein